MAIQSKTAVENEYENKRTAILAYDDAALAAELDSLVKFAAKVRELATILRAREAINDRSVSSSQINSLVTAANQIASTPEAVKAQFKLIKDLLAGPVEPTPPVVP